ncbi:MAG: PSD1 and planctomycete cytochrome C domain-containing protein [Pirellulaceae bacterium]
MTRLDLRLLCLLPLLLAIASSSNIVRAEQTQSREQQADFFESRIRPVFVAHCLECHAVDTEASGGLLLDSRQGWQAGGDSSNAIVPGDVEASRVARAIDYDDPNLQMPPAGKLPDEAIRDIKLWIGSGAYDPRDSQSAQPATIAGLAVEDAQTHWAYRDVQPVSIPAMSELQGATPIDAFINQRLAQAGVEPAPRATDEALVRRLYYDLLGLPPTLDQRSEAVRLLSQGELGFARLVDQLLGNTQYAENFARKWMDVVRYADSITLRGFVLPQAWRYRDYLVDAYANDRPFDQMIREQIAGDLLPAEDWQQKRRQWIATGLLVLGNTNLEKQDKTQLDMDTIDEQLEVIGRAFLGQTIGCARCHDHKFDPIPTRDYYALAGILRSAVSLKHDNVSKWIELPLPGPEELPSSEASQLPANASPTEQDASAMVMTLVEKNDPVDIPIHIRGEAHNLGAIVPRGFLTALGRDDAPSIPAGSSGRIELAQWLSAQSNPLTARVYANRIWSWLMTRGIAPSVNNLGTTGVAPTHPELLDWLARELTQHHWSTKHLVRTIVMSDVYCRSRLVESDARQASVDPTNQLVWRGVSRRLTVEALRDAMLQISGELDCEVGGSLIAEGTKADYNYVHRSTRRSLYHPVFRNSLPELYEAFDFADPSTSIGQRPRSTVATQGLVLLNNSWVVARARATAARLRKETRSNDFHALVADLYERCLARQPTVDELAACIEFLELSGQPGGHPGVELVGTATGVTTAQEPLPATDKQPLDALEALVHSLFASLDFRYLD